MFYSVYADRYKLSKQEIWTRASKYLPYIDEYSPTVADEIRGIAAGSERKLEEIAMLVCYYEIYDRLAFRSGCTSFAITGRATVDGSTYTGQNWDDDVSWYWNGEMPVLLREECDPSPNLLAYTYPGIPVGAGINSVGLALSWNTMHSEEQQVGVPTYAITTEVLHQKRIGDALGAIIRAKRAESFNFVLADAEGEIYDVEATPSAVDIIYSNRHIGHANNFLSTKLNVKQDVIVGYLPDTIVRANRMNRLLDERAGTFDLKIAMGLLKDHANYPKSICRHPSPEEGGHQGKTFDSWVMVPARREMWLCHGNPCQNEFEKYTI